MKFKGLRVFFSVIWGQIIVWGQIVVWGHGVHLVPIQGKFSLPETNLVGFDFLSPNFSSVEELIKEYNKFRLIIIFQHHEL